MISRFLHTPVSAAATVALCCFIVWAMPNTQEILGQLGRDEVRLPSIIPTFQWRPTVIWSIALTVIFCASILTLDANAQFLYFQF
jgi:hypothetical protein